MLSILRRSHARQAERLFTNRSLFEIEPVSTPPKRKLENSEQRPAPETQAQRTRMLEIAGQRPGPASPKKRRRSALSSSAISRRWCCRRSTISPTIKRPPRPRVHLTLGIRQKRHRWLSILRRSHARQAERLFTNRSLLEIEPVSTPPKRKLENSQQRPAPETQAQRTRMLEIAGQRPGRPRLIRGNLGDSRPPVIHTPETGLPGWGGRIRTLESRDAGDPGKGLTAVAGRLALTPHRSKEWTSQPALISAWRQ